MHQQRTIAEKVSCRGLALHRGGSVQLTLRPARAGTGIVFLCRSQGQPVEIQARPASVSGTSHATTLSSDQGAVSTVEHLLAALHALQIDNVHVELDAPEVPVMDGSAIPFVRLIQSAGVYRQGAHAAKLVITSPIEVVDGNRRISIEPCDGFRISYVVEFEHPAIGRQEYEVPCLDAPLFEQEIAPARTFGFLDEVNELWRNGLARGGSLANTVVLDDRKVMNPDGLRWPDEFVRHKVLDLIGDLALLGLPVDGHVRVIRGGHSLHHQLVRALLDTPSAWRVSGGIDGFAPGAALERRPVGTAQRPASDASAHRS